MASTNLEEIKKIIKAELPAILKTDPSFRRYIIQITKLYYPPKKKTEDRIEQLYQQILQMQEKSKKRWQEWTKRWDETQKTINEILKRLEKIDRRHLYTIGAPGARWGLY